MHVSYVTYEAGLRHWQDLPRAFDTRRGESALCSPFVNCEMTISGKQLFQSGSLSLSFVLVPGVGGSGLQTALPGHLEKGEQKAQAGAPEWRILSTYQSDLPFHWLSGGDRQRPGG